MKSPVLLFAFTILAVTNLYGQTNCCNKMAISGQTGPYCTTPFSQVPGNPNTNPPQKAGSYCPISELDTNLSCTSTDPALKSGTSCGSIPTNKSQAKGSYGWDSSGNFVVCNATFNSPQGVLNYASSTNQASTFTMEGTSYSGVTEGTCTAISPPNPTPSSCPLVACSTSSGGGTPPPPPPPCCTEPCGKPGWARNCANCQCYQASPIILDITGKGYNLTDAANGVMFDILGDGQPLQMGWTAQSADNAFLVLPAPDGLVHNGKQLFGNSTPQPPSNTPNGFAALAVYDDPKNGGNGDGIIDARDAIFSSLRLWIDANHDGISQPNEMYTLPALGINSISLNYKESDKTDQFGNVLRYRAQLNPDAATDAGKTAYDIFFVMLAPATTSAQSCPAPPTGKRPASSILKH